MGGLKEDVVHYRRPKWEGMEEDAYCLRWGHIISSSQYPPASSSLVEEQYHPYSAYIICFCLEEFRTDVEDAGPRCRMRMQKEDTETKSQSEEENIDLMWRMFKYRICHF